jgi:hypothetical protein
MGEEREGPDRYAVRRRVFDSVWDEEARACHCDGRGGAEYERVWREWVKGGARQAIRSFIRAYANMASDGTLPE